MSIILKKITCTIIITSIMLNILTANDSVLTLNKTLNRYNVYINIELNPKQKKESYYLKSLNNELMLPKYIENTKVKEDSDYLLNIVLPEIKILEGDTKGESTFHIVIGIIGMLVGTASVIAGDVSEGAILLSLSSLITIWGYSEKKMGGNSKYQHYICRGKIEYNIVDLLTGKQFVYTEKLKISNLSKAVFFSDLKKQCLSHIDQQFKLIRNENENPKITYEKNYSKNIRASNLGISLTLSDDVELSSVKIDCPESYYYSNRRIGGYNQKIEEFIVPLTVGKNNITINVEDWCGNTSSKTLNIFALKDMENTTVTLGYYVGEDILIEETVILSEKEEINIDHNLPLSNMKQPNSVAVVIGNKDYQNTAPVEYAINDAKTMKNYLIKTLGYKTGNIIYKENISKVDFEEIFGNRDYYQGRLFNMIKPKVSDVFVYYSGHGAPGLKNEKGYIVPVECDPNYLEFRGYSLETLYYTLSKLPAKSVTIVMDACFTGENVYQSISPIVVKVNNPAFTIPNGILFSSSQSSEPSSWYDEKGHGLFTYFFLRAICDYENSDLNKDNQLSYEEIYQYVSSQTEGVPYYSRRLRGRDQNPTLEGDSDRILFKYR